MDWNGRIAVMLLLISFWGCSAANAGYELETEPTSGRKLGFGRLPKPAPGVTEQERTINGVKTALWLPKDANAGPYPLVIFSHGFHGKSRQTEFLTRALAEHGYIVASPNHGDAMGGAHSSPKPVVPFQNPESWSDTTYKDRQEDVAKVIAGLRADVPFSKQVDWSRIALVGHSLGGYTALGLAGAWESWKIPNIKAIVALSPFCTPYVSAGTLKNISVPVMYQGGTRDFFVTPYVNRPNGAYAQTSSPALYVEFNQMGHFGWTGFNRNESQRELIDHYTISFLDKYVKGDSDAKPDVKLAGVTQVWSK